ncbi:hypothetical protein LTR27_009887 [Elasticomyces elasticus]|nr:hypothetical protein LTR27_009887 [Elasticomyces elasticus]
MLVIGHETHNGRALPFHKTDAGRAKAKIERQEEKLEMKRLSKTFRSQTYLPLKNYHLSRNPAETPIIQRNRFTFGKALVIEVPDKDDIIFIAAQETLSEYNDKSYHGMIDPIRIEALLKAPTIRYKYETKPEVYLLVREHTFIKLQLKLYEDDVAPGLAGYSAGSSEAEMAKLALEMQHRCWKLSGKPFRFTDLPVEMQNKTLIHAIGETVEPCFELAFVGRKEKTLATAYLGLTGFFRKHKTQLYVNPLPAQPYPVNTALLGLNKEIRQNALGVLLYDTTKRYTASCEIHLLSNSVSKLHLSFLSRIELAMSHLDYIGIFRCALKPFQNYRLPFGHTDLALQLTKLPNLQHLEIFFMSTIESSYTPWISYVTPDRSERTRRYPNIEFRRLPCQKVLVDQIMTFAAAYILKIKTLKVLKLTGFIKTETRLKFEGLLNERNGEVDHTDEIENMKREIVALPDYAFPPRCFCPIPCGYKAIDRVRSSTLNDGSSEGPAAQQYEEVFAAAVEKYAFDFDDTFEKTVSEDARSRLYLRSHKLPLPSSWDTRRGPPPWVGRDYRSIVRMLREPR